MGIPTGTGVIQPASHQSVGNWTPALLNPPPPPPARLPVVLTQQEVRAVLDELDGTPRLVDALLYGSGLRLLECLRLRVKDVDFYRNEILVHDGKGFKDRVTMLPAAVKKPLQTHLEKVRLQHADDLARDLGRVPLPDAIASKYPNADRQPSATPLPLTS